MSKPVQRDGAVERWWARTCERLRQPEARRVEISLQASEVRCHQQAESPSLADCFAEWFEDHRGQRASYNVHEAIHSARVAVLAEAQAAGACWKTTPTR